MTVGTNSGFDASTCTATNCVQALSGGLNGKWLISTDSLFFVEEAAPSASSSGQTRIYSDSTLHWPQLSANTGSYLPLAVSGAFSSFTNGHCVSASISGGQLSFVDAGGACTTGGGGGTVSSSAIGNIGYYSGATTIAGSADNTWNNSTQQATITGTSNSIAALTVLTGFIQTAGGLAVPSANTSTAAINALGGGVTSKWLIANDSLFLIAESQPSVSASGQARLYLDSTSFTINASINGGAYAPFGGGGGGSPIGPNTAIQFNNSGSFGGSANLLWVAGQDLVVTGVASTQTLWAKNGYLRADGGLIASSSCTNYNCIQSESAAGGMAARSFTATTYTKIGNSTGAPTLSTGDSLSAGVFYWDNGAGAAKIYNGSSYLTLATGGISSLNSLTGALNIVGTTNEITVTPSGTSITLATPQAIATTSNVTFNNVTATGSNSFISTTTGTNYALVVNGGTMLIQGNGQWSSSGAAAINGTSGSLNLPSATAINSVQTSGGVNVNSTGSGNGGYQVTGSTVINSSGQWVGGAVLANGNVQTTGVYAVSGGYFGISHNVTIGSCTMYFQGGILYSTSGGC